MVVGVGNLRKPLNKFKVNQTPPPCGRGRNEESCGDREHERPAVIPLIARLIPVGIDQLTFVIAIGIEHVRVAIGVGNV